MNNPSDNPRLRLARLLSAASGTAIPSADAANLPDPILMAASRKWLLLPRVRGSVIQPVSLEQATCDIPQLGEWAKLFPGCGWVLRTGPESGVIALEADLERGLGAVRRLSESDCPDTLIAHAAGLLLVFFRYPEGFRAFRAGRIVLGSGLAVCGDNDQVRLPAHNLEAWPNLHAEVLAAPDWLLSCAFEPVQDAVPIPPKHPPLREIVGVTEWRSRRLRRS